MGLRNSVYVPPSQYSLKADTRLVEVGVVVRESNGHTVGGLTRDDFEIEDGGKKREISAFTAETLVPRAAAPGVAVPATPAAAASKAPPRYLGLVFDDLSMGPGDLIPARKAAKKFVSEGISPGDQVGIFFLSRGQVLPFTADLEKLMGALDKLTVATRNPVLPNCPNLTSYEVYVLANQRDPTLLPIKVAEAIQCGFCQRRDPTCASNVETLASSVWRDIRFTSQTTIASIRSVVDSMARLQGKRVLLIASSGFLSGTLEAEREEVVNRAIHAGVVINSLDAKGLYTQDSGISRPGLNVRSTIARQSQGTRPQWESNDTMAVLASGTGGLFFQNNNDLELGFRELGIAPEFSYSLAFTPPGSPDGKFHNLKVRLKESRHYTVQARLGYFSAIAAAAAPPVERRIDKEVLAGDSLDEVPASLSASGAKTASGDPVLRVVLRVDVPHLPFVTQSGVRSQKLTIIAALFDDAGSFVTGKECEVDFHLKENTFNLMSSGVGLSLTLSAPAGKYRLRGVIQDGNGGKITASSQAVELE